MDPLNPNLKQCATAFDRLAAKIAAVREQAESDPGKWSELAGLVGSQTAVCQEAASSVVVDLLRA